MRWLNSDLRRFYASVAFRNFGMALISLFIPVYLYSTLKVPFMGVVLYWLLQQTFTVIADLVAGKFIARYSARASMALSIPLSFVGFFLLPYAANPVAYVLTALFQGFVTAFYWVPFHVVLARASSKQSVGSATGKTWAFQRLSSIVAPLIGGVMLQFVSYNSVFVLLVFFQMIALYLLPQIKQYEPNPRYAHTFSKVSRRQVYAWFSQGLSIEAGDGFWPLYAFFILGGYAFLGSVEFGAGIFVALFSLWVGRQADRLTTFRLLNFAWLGGAFAWLARSLAYEPISVLLANALGSMAFMTMELGVMPKLYAEGVKNDDVLARVVLREVTLRLALLPLTLAILVLPLKTVFGLVALFFFLRWISYR